MTMHVVDGSSNETQPSNVIQVAPCPLDQVLNRERGTLGNSTHFKCRKCGSMYALTLFGGPKQ